MAKHDNKINLPSSGAGLTKYFDDYKSKIMFSPEVAVISILVIILVVLIISGRFVF